MLLIGFIATSTGLIQYQDNFKKERDYTWFAVHLVIVTIVVAIAEVFNFVRHYVHRNIVTELGPSSKTELPSVHHEQYKNA